MSAFEEVITRKVRDAGVYLPAGVLTAILRTSEITELAKRATDPSHPLPAHVTRWCMTIAEIPHAPYQQLLLPDELQFKEKVA